MTFKNIHQRKKDFLEMCALYIAHICYKHITDLSFVFSVEKQEKLLGCFNSGVSQDINVNVKFTSRRVYGSIDAYGNRKYTLYLNLKHCSQSKGVLLETLAHELRHIWQLEKKPGLFNDKLPYKIRPHEIDANDFAAMVLNNIGIKKCN